MQTEPTAQTDDARQWLPVSEAARRLGISARSIQRRCSAQTLPARRVQGERGKIWEVEAQAIRAEVRERDKHDGDSDRTTATSATQSKRVAVILPFPRSNSATGDDDDDGDSATFDSDKRDSVAVSVAVEAERLRAELEASRSETQRERELSDFLKSQLEEANRNAAELRAALRKALEIAPRQLTQGNAPDSPQSAEIASAGNNSHADANAPQKPAKREGARLTIADICDELDRKLGI